MRHVLSLVALLLFVLPASAQDRDTKVRNDREAFSKSKDWIYNDLAEGMKAAKDANKPLLVVFRCIPCEACQEFDDDVARRDPIIRDLLDKFVCVRIVQANAIDLTRFQHDFDLSFAAYLMNPDGTIYGRFGTRSDRPEEEDISLEGLREAMKRALALHSDFESIKPFLAGKQVRPSRYKTPRDYPSLSGKYGERLDYEGKVAKSCIHCHQVREAERLTYREAKEPMPEPVLYPYPDPEVLGLRMDPKLMLTVASVEPGSIAAKAGMKAGDQINMLDGQVLLSTADIQWALHNAPSTAKLEARLKRGEKDEDLTLDLPEGWRRGNISWRASTWDLRRMALGGMKLHDLTDEQRREAGLPADAMALKVEHVGEYGDHAVAKKAGFRAGDVIVAFDGLSGRMTESAVIAHAIRKRRKGDEVAATVLRGGERVSLRFVLQ